MSKIVEALVTEQYGSKHYYLIVDRKPKFLYQRKGNLISSRYKGFISSFVREPGTTKAFAGRSFTIPMQDGSALEATGQYWSAGQLEAAGEDVVSVGVATRSELKKCYVFMGHYITKNKLDNFLNNNPDKIFSDYWKYSTSKPPTAARPTPHTVQKDADHA